MVIAIIGILVALLLPAIQAAREAARRSQCQNNLKQLGLGFMNHESLHGHFPTGGWGHMFIGDPDRGVGKLQPGGWIFNILPFVEKQALHDIGAGLSYADKEAAAYQMVSTPVETFSCPSRRPPSAFAACCKPSNLTLPGTPFDSTQAKTDYAANFGSNNDCAFPINQNPTGHTAPCLVFGRAPMSTMQFDSVEYTEVGWPNTQFVNGISFTRSEVTIAQITDGTSNTYAVGEKYVNPLYYSEWTYKGGDPGDDWSMYSGQQDDLYRTTYANLDLEEWTTPEQDRVGVSRSNNQPNVFKFGSSHPGGCHMAMCDGSVQVVSYDVDPVVHALAGSRNDGGVNINPASYPAQ